MKGKRIIKSANGLVKGTRDIEINSEFVIATEKLENGVKKIYTVAGFTFLFEPEGEGTEGGQEGEYDEYDYEYDDEYDYEYDDEYDYEYDDEYNY